MSNWLTKEDFIQQQMNNGKTREEAEEIIEKFLDGLLNEEEDHGDI